MRKKYAEVLCEIPNRAVIHLSDRSFPGAVLQGDQLYRLMKQLESVWDRATELGDESLLSNLSGPYMDIHSLFQNYNNVCKEKNNSGFEC